MMKLKSKKIFIFTTNRADYGLLKTFILLCKKSKIIKPLLVVTGSHLQRKFGYTYEEIKDDNYIKQIKVFVKVNGDRPEQLASSMANNIKAISKILKKKKPDLIVVLGDRIELIPICYSALLFNIPIVHFNGGELTEGLMDDAIRHSVTKLSHIHFVSNEIYKKRVIQMGENPKKVFNIGGTSIDNIKNTKLLKKEQLEKKLGLQFNKKTFLVTYHPVTLDKKNSEKEINNLLNVLSNYKNNQIIITGTNIDPNNNYIKKKISKFSKRNSNVKYFDSLGHTNYLSIMNTCDLVVGNSSSGILEAPFLKKPVINIGIRQGGRLKSKNIISCKSSKKDIERAFKISESRKFKNQLKNFKTFYGNGNTSKKAIKILEKINLENILIKKFYE